MALRNRELRYAIVSCMPETTTTLNCHHSCCHAEPRKPDLEVTARYLNEVIPVQHMHLTNIHYGSGCWAISKTNARRIDALYLRMLLGIKWYQFVRNDDVWRLTKQPKAILTTIIQSHRHRLVVDMNEFN